MLLQRFYRRDETRGYSDRSNERPTDYKQGCNTHVFSQISRYQYPQQGRERAQTKYQRKRAPENFRSDILLDNSNEQGVINGISNTPGKHQAHKSYERIDKKLLYSPFIIINNTKTPDFTFLGVKSGVYFTKH